MAFVVAVAIVHHLPGLLPGLAPIVTINRIFYRPGIFTVRRNNLQGFQVGISL